MGAAGAVLSKLIQKEADPFDYAEPIPEEILNHPDWPAPAELQSAIMIRKADAEKIKYPFWSSLCVTVNGVNFNIMADFFSRKGKFNRKYVFDLDGFQSCLRSK